MRLERSDTVDFIGVSKSGDQVVLTLADDFEGPDQGLRYSLLQKKAYHYLDFVASGQVWEHVRLADLGGQVRQAVKVVVQIAARQGLDDAGQQFLLNLQGVAKSEGVEVVFRQLGKT